MLLDQKHSAWLKTVVLLAGVAAVLYVPYHLGALNGPSGGSVPGLLYGIAGFLLLLFVGLLGLRRTVPAWRIGRLEFWMRGHIWLGLLGALLILFHAGFQFGGTLTTVLMGLLIVLTVSGIFGVILQQILPRMMTAQVKLETIYEQIVHVTGQLSEEAETHVSAVAGPIEGASESAGRSWSGIPDSTRRPRTNGEPLEGSPTLKDFYMELVRPYLSGEKREGPLSDPSQATLVFSNIRTLLPPPLHETLSDLEAICEEHRQLRRQERLHHWLHGWLLLHVPLSYLFLILAILHAIYAMAY